MMTLVALPFGRGSVLKSYSWPVRIVQADIGQVVGGLLDHVGGDARRSLRAPPGTMSCGCVGMLSGA